MLMQPNAPAPAPPPLTPAPVQQDPYDFIVNKPHQPKKSLFGGGSKKQRVIFISIAGVILLIVVIIVFSLISGGGSSRSQEWLKLAQEQTEAIRISGLGSESATDSNAKNLAITAKTTLESQQATILKYAKSSGANTKAASLALGKNVQTDAQLTTAKQANSFDGTFTKILQSELLTYAQNIKKLHDSSNDTKAKTTLAAYFNAVRPLLATSQ